MTFPYCHNCIAWRSPLNINHRNRHRFKQVVSDLRCRLVSSEAPLSVLKCSHKLVLDKCNPDTTGHYLEIACDLGASEQIRKRGKGWNGERLLRAPLS